MKVSESTRRSRVRFPTGWTLVPNDERAPAPGPGVRARSIARRVGIGLGVAVFALVLIGQGIFLAESIGGATAGAQPVITGTLAHRLQVVLSRALGPSDRGVRRFRITRIATLPGHRGTDVDIEWAINNDLSGGTIGNGAQAEVYTMLRALYSSHLGIARVRLTGTYPVHSGRRDSVVMRLSMGRQTATLIGGIGWDNVDPPTLWPLVDRAYVNPSLQPQVPE